MTNRIIPFDYQLLVHKITWYCRWYDEMNIQDKKGWLGHWVKQRIKWYDEVINRNYDGQ